MLDISKCGDFPKIPIAKNIVWEDKCFLLQAIANSSKEIGIKVWDWLLFKKWEPRLWDIIILGTQWQSIYRLGIYHKNDKWYHIIKSVLEDWRPAIIDKHVNIYGILKENLWDYW